MVFTVMVKQLKYPKWLMRGSLLNHWWGTGVGEGTSLSVPGLKLRTANAGGLGFDPWSEN